MEALKEIGKRLGKTDWHFNVDPCGGVSSGWISNPTPFDTNFNNTVICDCTFHNNTVCHVTNMYVPSSPSNIFEYETIIPFNFTIYLKKNYLPFLKNINNTTRISIIFFLKIQKYS